MASCAGIPDPVPTSTMPLELPSVESATTAPTAIVRVNGESISEESFERHLSLYRAALEEAGTFLAPDNAETIVLDDLISRLLLAQSAQAEGYAANEDSVAERLVNLIEEAGGQSAFDEWLFEFGFSAESFAEELSIEMEAGWMRTKISEKVPSSAEQVLARQILLSDRFQAERLLAQLEGGTPFETIVANNDPQRLGTLGWFPRGFLLQAEVEETAFAMQAGETSGIVESDLGFHLIEVLGRDPDKELSPQARLQMQMQALDEWLAAARAESDIEVLLP